MTSKTSVTDWHDPDSPGPSARTAPICRDHEVPMVWADCNACGTRGFTGLPGHEVECQVCDGWGGWFQCPVDGWPYKALEPHWDG